MNPDVKTRWVAALRSDRYAQGRGKLARLDPDGGPPSYCCLGVLCEVAVQAGVVVRVLDTGDVRSFDGAVNYLPEAVRAWAQLPAVNPVVRDVAGDGNDVVTALSAFNDRGVSFARIAQLIEEEL